MDRCSNFLSASMRDPTQSQPRNRNPGRIPATRLGQPCDTRAGRFQREGSSTVRHSCRDLFHHGQRGWAGGRRQKNCRSMEVQTKVKKPKKIPRTYRKGCTTTHTNALEMRAKHACNSYKCITRLIVTGTRHYYAGWAWSCTNFVHSAGTARAQRAKCPLSLLTPRI